MEIIRKIKNIELNMPSIFNNYSLEDIIILDIETTGLHRTYSRVILVGIIRFNMASAEIIQIFADKTSEEVDLLKALDDIIKDKSLILTYNGQAFDIPYLNEKFKQHNLSYEIPIYKSFDLLRLIRKNKSKLKLDNYKLKSIEEFLGIYREDTISGKESIELYNEYLKTSSPCLKSKILLHNFEDILNIIDLINIFDYCNDSSIYEEYKLPISIDQEKFSNTDIELLNKSYPGCLSKGRITIYLHSIKFLRESIKLSFYAPNFSLYDLDYKNRNMFITFNTNTLKLELEIPILNFSTENDFFSFIDIDPILGDHIFNSLCREDKFLLNVLYNKEINYKIIENFLKKYLLNIMCIVSK